MILEIRECLNAAELKELHEIAARSNFVDGRQSNAGYAQKLNLQMDQGAADYTRSSAIVSEALYRAPEFRDFVFPKRVAPPLLARYEVGMKYGAHADSAFVVAPGGTLRSDISCTVFLEDPQSYDGGELVLHLGDRPVVIKGVAGSAVLYPSTTMHEVTPVRRGQRLVSITFIESLIPDEQKRFMIFELGEVSALEGNTMNEINRMRLELVRQNLIRRWSSA